MLRISKITGLITGMALIISLTTVAQDLKSAIKLTESEQFVDAQKSFEALIAKEPAAGDNYFYFGECMMKQFFVDSMSVSLKDVTGPALKYFNKGMEAEPGNPLNYIGAAKVYYMLGQNSDAAEKIKKAKELMPLQGMNYKKSTVPVKKQSLSYAKIAEARLKAPDKTKEELLEILANATERDATVPEVFLIKGDVYLNYNDGSNAIVAYNKANDLDPQSCKAMVKIGQLWVRGRDYPGALNYYKDAIKIDSAFAPAYRERAELYGLANQWENAIKDYEKFLELSGNNYYAKSKYAQFLFMAKKYEESIAITNEVLTVDPNSYIVLYRILAYSSYEIGKYSEGIKATETFFREAKPEKIIVSDYTYWGDLLVKNNDDSSAIEKYLKAFEMDSKNCDLLTKIAKSYTKLKDYDNTLKIYQKKIDTDCASLQDKYDMAKTYYNLGNNLFNDKNIVKAFENWEKADTLFGTVLKEKPDFYYAINNRAKLNISIDTAFTLGTAVKWYEVLIPLALADTVKYARDIYTAYDYIRFYYYKQYILNKKCEDAKKSVEYCEKILAIDPKDEKAIETKKGLKSKCPN